MRYLSSVCAGCLAQLRRFFSVLPPGDRFVLKLHSISTVSSIHTRSIYRLPHVIKHCLIDSRGRHNLPNEIQFNIHFTSIQGVCVSGLDTVWSLLHRADFTWASIAHRHNLKSIVLSRMNHKQTYKYSTPHIRSGFALEVKIYRKNLRNVGAKEIVTLRFQWMCG